MSMQAKLRASLFAFTALWTFAATAGGADTTEDRALAAAAESKKAPPQYVHLAFDGSKSLFMWEHTVDKAQELSKIVQETNPSSPGVRFTYFINTPYFMMSENRMAYTEPTKGTGKICISWGEEPTDLMGNNERWRTQERSVDTKISDPARRLLRRMELMNRAFEEGHELASHANSHCKGDGWSPAQWMSEMDQFYKILFNYTSLNKLGKYLVTEEDKAKYLPRFTKEDIRGFRAPELGVAPGMWPALKKHGITFDTSLDDILGAWPRKKKDANGEDMGIWLFPLTNILIVSDVRPGKSNLSMDYNFYVSQTGGAPSADAEVQKRIEEEMYQSYLKYFAFSYLGNRAPIHIGHHFSRWNEGAYWRAFQRVATKICGLPDVRCVPYSNLASYLDGVKAKQVSTGVPYLSKWAENSTLGRDSLRAQYGSSIEPAIAQINGWARLRTLDPRIDAEPAPASPTSPASPFSGLARSLNPSNATTYASAALEAKKAAPAELAVYVAQDDDGKTLTAKSRILLPETNRAAKSPVASSQWYIAGKLAFEGQKVDKQKVLAYAKKQGLALDQQHDLHVIFNNAKGKELMRFEAEIKIDAEGKDFIIVREGDHGDL